MLSIFYLLFTFPEIQTIGPSFEAPIGNYSQYIPLYPQCGLTKTDIERRDCFQYHKDFFPRIINARDVRLGEAPWLVGIKRRRGWWIFSWGSDCAGSLISDRWVLTVAHCVVDKGTYTVWLGPEFEQGQSYEVNAIHTHPEYDATDIYKTYADIGLIRLKEQVKFGENGKYLKTNFICLPEVNMTIDPDNQLALISGWGKKNSWYRDDHKLPKIGGLKMDFHTNQYNSALGMKFFTHEVLTCHGDSGSPIWTYHMGRAYQIGILSTMVSPGKDGCDFPNSAVYVPRQMDWILKTIENN